MKQKMLGIKLDGSGLGNRPLAIIVKLGPQNSWGIIQYNYKILGRRYTALMPLLLVPTSQRMKIYAA